MATTILPHRGAEGAVVFSRRGHGSRNNKRIQKHRNDLCPETGLIRFRDRRQAKDALSSWREFKVSAQGIISRHEITSCRCPYCNGGFHLISPSGSLEMTTPKSSAVPAVFPLSTRPCSCHLIDVENQMGGGNWTAADVKRWWQIYRQQAVGVAQGDLVIVGVAERTAKKVRIALRGEDVRWRIGNDGPDGADFALLHAVNVTRISRRYSRLVLASGDHIFAPLMQQARALGMTVQIVSGRGRVSRELKDVPSVRTRIRPTSLEAQRQALAAIRTVHAAVAA